MRLTLLIAVFCVGCSLVPAATVAPAAAPTQKESGAELVAQANHLLDSITSRLSERELVASVASENLELLDQRAKKLRERFAKMDPRSRGAIEPHLEWVGEVHDTTTLCIGV